MPKKQTAGAAHVLSVHQFPGIEVSDRIFALRKKGMALWFWQDCGAILAHLPRWNATSLHFPTWCPHSFSALKTRRYCNCEMLQLTGHTCTSVLSSYSVASAGACGVFFVKVPPLWLQAWPTFWHMQSKARRWSHNIASRFRFIAKRIYFQGCNNALFFF